jgi:putative peptidoglycan lipid II flippase
MRYANFIVLTPLGIISNMILVPFLPVFSRLASPENWEELKMRIRQGLILTALTMFPLTAIFTALSNPIVRIIYERGVFKSSDSGIVAPVLLAYGTGMFFYLARDVLVRVFYALGDGQTPFKISIINIFVNLILDYLLVQQFQTQGLVFSTIGVNIFSIIALIWILHKRLNNLPLKQWFFIFLGLVIATIISSFACGITNQLLVSLWDEKGLLIQLVNLSLSSLIGVGVFFLVIMPLKLPELDILCTKISAKFSR